MPINGEVRPSPSNRVVSIDGNPLSVHEVYDSWSGMWREVPYGYAVLTGTKERIQPGDLLAWDTNCARLLWSRVRSDGKYSVYGRWYGASETGSVNSSYARDGSVCYYYGDDWRRVIRPTTQPVPHLVDILGVKREERYYLWLGGLLSDNKVPIEERRPHLVRAIGLEKRAEVRAKLMAALTDFDERNRPKSADQVAAQLTLPIPTAIPTEVDDVEF